MTTQVSDEFGETLAMEDNEENLTNDQLLPGEVLVVGFSEEDLARFAENETELTDAGITYE